MSSGTDTAHSTVQYSTVQLARLLWLRVVTVRQVEAQVALQRGPLAVGILRHLALLGAQYGAGGDREGSQRHRGAPGFPSDGHS